MPVFDPIPEAPHDADLPVGRWGPGTWSVLPWAREAVDRGYNSHTWKIERDSGLQVLKAVPAEHRERFRAGLTIAEVLAGRGMATGSPTRLPDGDLVTDTDGWCWALLDHLDGERVDETDPRHLAAAGAALGRIHTLLREVEPPSGVMVWGQMDWLLADGDFLEPHPWIRHVLRDAMASVPAGLVTGVVHGDPRLTEFRIAGSVAGVLDWGEVMIAPHVFDIATVLNYLDPGTDPGPLLEGYLGESVVGPDELAHVDALRRFRYAAEAWIYARRDHFGITLGFEDSENTNVDILERKRKDIEAIDAVAAGDVT